MDLLYVTNFKGGAGTINEPPASLAVKLPHYEAVFTNISTTFGAATLGTLSVPEVTRLIALCDTSMQLTLPGHYPIDGFKASRVSTLLHFHFPHLIPILDRRALNGSGIRAGVTVNNQKQVQNIENHYGALVAYCHARLAAGAFPNLVQLDQDLFTEQMQPPYV